MGAPKPSQSVAMKEAITMEEARTLVHSLPERAKRLELSATEPERNIVMIPLGSIGVGSVLTAAAFSSRVPSRFRYMAAAGAIMSAGALALFSLSTLISSYDKVEQEKPFDRLLDKLDSNPQLKEEMAEYFTKHVSRREISSGAKSDIMILGQALQFCEEKKLVKKLSQPAQQPVDKAWTKRDYSPSSSAGRQIFHSGSNT